jgi:hypothetical protein
MAAMAMATVRMAEVMLLLMFLTQIFGVRLAAAARPLEGAGWTAGGIGMVTEMLANVKQSGPNPPTHCC